MSGDRDRPWIPDVEIENAQIKWAFSHFDGRADTFNDEGDHNFQIMLPEEQARELMEAGWAIREMPAQEEGDPPEYLLKVKISFRYEPPLIYLLKSGRRFRVDDPRDLADIRRDLTDQIDVVLTPYHWTNGAKTGVTAYAKELYAQVRPSSRFAERYAEYENA